MLNLVIFSMLIGLFVAEQGSNLIINGNFSQPSFVGQWAYFPSSILGWSCTFNCEINNCADSIKGSLKYSQTFPLCQGQVIDLNSNKNEMVSQSISLKAGDYQLAFNYFYPQQKATKKQFRVTFNNQQILFFHPQQDTYIYANKFIQTLECTQGINLLSFENFGLNDFRGFKINNVSLYRVINRPLEATINNFLTFHFFTKLVSFPGGRVFFGQLLGFCINLDRYEFYAYHKRLYSYNHELLLKKIIEFQQLKGMLFASLLKGQLPSYASSVQEFFNSLNFKKYYVKYGSFVEEINGGNFSTYLKDFASFSLPIALLLFFVLHLLFKLLFQHPFSKWLRPYSFFGLLFPLLLEGNIEAITFHVFAEFKSYFSLTYAHKFFNTFVALVFFLVLLMCLGFYLLGKYHYRSRARFVLGTKKSSLSAVLSQNIDRGISVALYGATHQLLLEHPTPQLAALAILQITMIVKRWKFRREFSHRIYLFLSISNGLIRIYFQVTTYLYSLLQQQRFTLNQRYHSILIILLISKIAFDSLIGLFSTLKQGIQSKIRLSNRISNRANPISKKSRKGKINCSKFLRLEIVHVHVNQL